MDIKDLAIPEVYRESADFRFFLKWFSECLSRTTYDTENFFDLYDPLRCPEDLIWALADTMGYKFDSRLPASFNRLVLLYFMSMIRNRGSKDGVTLAAEANLAQFHILMDAAGYTDEDGNEVPGKDILYNRLEDTSIPVNSVYVTPHTESGFIDVVYYSTRVPTDACIEYVRPLGMYLFQHAGVDFHARTKISIDARLTDERDRTGLSDNFGPTQVGHYTRYDYSSLQKGPSVISKKLPDMTSWTPNDTKFTFSPSIVQDPQYGDCFKLYIGDSLVSERVYIELDVEPGMDYVITFKYKTTSTIMNENGRSQMFVAPYSELSKIKNIDPATGKFRNYMYSQIDRIGVSQRLDPSDNYSDYSVRFNSGDNDKVIVALDWGAMKDPDTLFGYILDYYYATLYFTNVNLEKQIINDPLHVRDRVWSRNSEAEYRKAFREEINPGYRSLYSLQLANNEHIVKSLIDPIFSLGYGPHELGITYPDDYLKPEYMDRYETDTSTYGNISNLNAWENNYPDRWSISYNPATKSNICHINTSEGWERLYIKYPVTRHIKGKVSLIYNHGVSKGGTIPVYVTPLSSLSQIRTLHHMPDSDIVRISEFLELPAGITDGPHSYELEFDPGDNDEVYVVISGGGRDDEQSDDFEISNIMLTQIVAKPYNLRYDRDLEESIRGDSVMDDPTSEPDIYTVEDRENPSTIVRPLPAVNPIMSKMGDAISLDPLNTRYISTKESDESDIHVEEVSTDD